MSRPGQRPVHRGVRRQPQGRQHPSQPLRAGRCDIVHGAVRGHGGLAAQVLHGHPAAVDGDPDRHLAGLGGPPGDQVQHRHRHGVQGHRLVRPGQFNGVGAVAVADHQQPRGQRRRVFVHQPAPHLRRVRGPLPQILAEQPGQPRQVGGDPAGRHRAVQPLAVQGVRQPLHPLPVRQPLRRTGHGHGHVVRGVEDRGLRQQRPYQPRHVSAFADHAHVAGPVQRHRQRQVAGGLETVQQRVRLIEHERVGRGQHTAARLRQAQRPHRQLAHPDPHLQEIRVRPAPLPQPRRVAHDVVQRLRRRRQHPRRLPPPPLLRRQLLPQLLQILQIPLPLCACAAPCRAGTAAARRCPAP